jgi:hypothetical protein
MIDEHAEQVLVVDYIYKQYGNDILFFSVPNGARLASGRGRDAQRIAAIRMNKLKAEGLLPGVSDLIIFEPRGGYSAMFLEMKRADGGCGASESQLEFIAKVESRGGYGVVANGFDEAKIFIDDYLNGRIKATA